MSFLFWQESFSSACCCVSAENIVMVLKLIMGSHWTTCLHIDCLGSAKKEELQKIRWLSFQVLQQILHQRATHLSVLSLRHITHATRQFLEDQGMVPLILSSPVLMQRALNVSQPHLFSVDSKWYLNVGWEQTKVGRSFVQHGWWGKFKALFILPTVAVQELLGGARLLCATAAVAGFAAA